MCVWGGSEVKNTQSPPLLSILERLPHSGLHTLQGKLSSVNCGEGFFGVPADANVTLFATHLQAFRYSVSQHSLASRTSTLIGFHLVILGQPLEPTGANDFGRYGEPTVSPANLVQRWVPSRVNILRLCDICSYTASTPELHDSPPRRDGTRRERGHVKQ